MNKIRILVVDDHALFREGLRRLLEGEPDMEMAGLCGTVDESIKILGRSRVDIVLLDYDLGTENGFEFIQRARSSGFGGRILMLTAGMSDAESVRVLTIGIGGIFLKHSSPASLAVAIRRVVGGGRWVDQASLQALVDAAARPEPPKARRTFTEREKQVMHGVFEGFSNKEIGARLRVSESSVKATLQQLFQKTGVRTRSQLVRIVLEDPEWRASANSDGGWSGRTPVER